MTNLPTTVTQPLNLSQCILVNSWKTVQLYSDLSRGGARGSGGMPPRKFFEIDAKILQFGDISTCIKCFCSACRYLRYAATACVNGKVSVSSTTT